MSQGFTTPKIKSSLSPESERVINDFLMAHPVGVLSTVDGVKPHATTLYFGTSPDFVITFTTKEDTKKSEVLDKNSRVCLVTFDSSTQTTVQIIGQVRLIDSFEDAKKAFDATVDAAERTTDSDIPPIAKLYAGKYLAYQIVPEEIRLAVFASPDPGGYDLYQTIEFES